MAAIPKRAIKSTSGLRGQVRRESNRRLAVYFTLLALVFGLVLYGLFFGDAGIFRYFELRSNKERIEAEILRLDRENKALSQQVNSLKKDPYYIEKYAREEYGLAKKDELIFQFKKDEQ